MDSGGGADLLDKPKDSWEKKDESIGTIEVNDDVSPQTMVLPVAPECLVPITPDTIRENGDFPIDIHSPLTVVRNQLKLVCINCEGNGNDNGSNIAFVDNDDGSPRTPKDAVFDPFAPGPDSMGRARPPHYKKYLDELSMSVARQLNFEPSFDAVQHQNSLLDAESLSDQDMLESVYESLLEVIVSKQTEGFFAQMSNVEYDSEDCKTPRSPLRLTGRADTCPGAPLKLNPVGKPRNTLMGLCKKLEF